MKKAIFYALLFLIFVSNQLMAANGDTIVVQTFTFGSPQKGWFNFPSDTVGIEKILMQYTLKCNPGQSPACGEWDYLTNTYLYKHTGLMDSTLIHQPTFTVNGATPSNFVYMNTPSYSYHASWNHFIVHTSSSAFSSYNIGTGTTASNLPFGASAPVSRCQYLWRASELTASGMTAGDITGLQFFFYNTGSLLNNLTIKMKATTADTLTAVNLVSTGQTNVYSSNTQFVPTGTGYNSIQFTTPFNWDGVSNIVIEIAYDNAQSGIDNVIASETTSFKSGITNAGADRAAKFHNDGYIDIPMNQGVTGIDSFVTVSYWAYGDPLLQPMDGTCFEAVDSDYNRLLNSHCPWSDSNVYWDAGNVNGSYDRCNKVATATQMKGQWNYWTFTKSCSNHLMRVYLNGNLFTTGGSKPKRMQGIDHFRLGKGHWAGSNTYEGRMDEFAVFNTELSQTTIKQWMNKKFDASHPNYSNLVLYYHFDDGNFSTAADSAPGAHNPAAFMGGVGNPLKPSNELINNFSETQLRPNIVFEKGVYTSHLDSTLVIDSTMLTPVQLISYNDSINQPGVATDTITVWPAYYNQYVYDATGNVIDSTLVPPDHSINLAYYDFYSYKPQVITYELSRFITPYGNNLSLGNGFTWTYDVSDYRTLLADSVNLTAGNWQELMDMKFIFIKGIPPRNILSIQNLRTGNFDYGVAADPIDNHLLPVSAKIPANATMARWKSRVTGHGMDTPENCAEFCPKLHYYKVDNVQRYSKLVWRDNCDFNPLYPQGGTWVYDRANWCPGAEVWTYDFEISNWITPGDSVSLDHDVQAYTHSSGWDYYQIQDQLVTYSAPNFTQDASIVDILSPGNNQMWARMNPVCSAPVIIIKNTGSTPLTSLQITYGLNGLPPSVYNWTGNLNFLDTTIVTLGNFNWGLNATKFYAFVSNPNGGADQYAYNDTLSTVFTYPPGLPSTLVIALKTNSSPSENHYTLMDDAGNVVFSRNGLAANTLYSDTLVLSNGCYKFDLRDAGEDGLTWWANTAQGSGSLRFINPANSAVINNFNSDFGGQIYQQFTVGLSTGIDYILATKTALNVYPNPSHGGDVVIDFNLTQRQHAGIEIHDIVGKKVFSQSIENTTAASLQPDLSRLKPGVYIVSLHTKDEHLTKKLIIE